MARPSFLPYRALETRRIPDDAALPFDPLEARRRWLRSGEPRPEGRYVLYWMQMAQRARSNDALNEAIRRGNALGLPVVVYQGLNPDYPGASDRMHRFILEAARDTAELLAERGIRYVFWLRYRRSERRRTAVEMIRRSALTIVDDFPAFIIPRVTSRAVQLTEESGVPVLAFDTCGVVPLAAIPDRQLAARTMRPRIHRLLPTYLWPADEVEPDVDGSNLSVPVRGIEADLPQASDHRLAELVSGCEIDHTVLPSLRYRGGRRAGSERLEAFVERGLPRYHEVANDPGATAASGLSPYLHFGCLDAREVALRVLRADHAPGVAVDAFLEQLVVRRELSYNFCRHTPLEKHTSLAAVPEWARETMTKHAADPRPAIYTSADLERGGTHDGVWNAAQAELVATGTFHNYLRMQWGKNLIRWTETYERALALMVELHHRYALDGRNPNTYANVLWCFGLHDRPFQERDVLGKLRPLNSERTRAKFDLGPYFERVAAWVRERDMPVLRGADGTPGGAIAGEGPAGRAGR